MGTRGPPGIYGAFQVERGGHCILGQWFHRASCAQGHFSVDFDRQLYRITLVGEKLVGVDGRTSTSIEGLPVLSAAEELKLMAAEVVVPRSACG